jgi:hypothetical protein
MSAITVPGKMADPGRMPGVVEARGIGYYWTVSVPVMFGWTSHQNV